MVLACSLTYVKPLTHTNLFCNSLVIVVLTADLCFSFWDYEILLLIIDCLNWMQQISVLLLIAPTLFLNGIELLFSRTFCDILWVY